MSNSPPARVRHAACPYCSHAVRVKDDGTLADHPVPQTIPYSRRTCPGSGRAP